MRLTKLPDKYTKYLHPSYRNPLLRGRKQKKRLVKRNVLQQIRRKYRLADIQPRIPALHCRKCGLATRFLRVIKWHDCTLKNIYNWRGTGQGACAELNTLGDDYIDEDLLARGGTNRMRDGMGILERFARPQNVLMYSTHYSQPTKLRSQPRTYTVPTLFSLADATVKANSNLHTLATRAVPMERVFEHQPMEIVSKRRIGKAHQDGHLCRGCSRLFASFDDYDSHLAPSLNNHGKELNPCRSFLPEPIPVLLNDSGNTPSSFSISSRRSRRLDRPPSSSCTGCGMEGFLTPSHFHSHIIQCAKRIQYERVVEAINQKKHLLNNKIRKV